MISIYILKILKNIEDFVSFFGSKIMISLFFLTIFGIKDKLANNF